MFIKLEILKVHTSQNCSEFKCECCSLLSVIFLLYCKGCCKEISRGMAKGKVFIVLKRESRLEVGKQEDSIAGENRSDYKKGTSERIATRGKE